MTFPKIIYISKPFKDVARYIHNNDANHTISIPDQSCFFGCVYT